MAAVYGPYWDKRRRHWKVIAIRDDGTRGTPTFETEAEAQAEYDRCIQYQAQKASTVGDLLPLWLASLAEGDACEKTKLDAKGAVLQILREDQPLRSLTPRRAQEAYDAARPKFAAATHRQGLSRCRGLCAFGVRKGYLRGNPFAEVKPMGRPREGADAHPQLTVDEIRLFLQHAAPRTDPGSVAAACCYLLGKRVADLVGGADTQDERRLPGCAVRDLAQDGSRLQGLGKGHKPWKAKYIEEEIENYPIRERLLGLAKGKTPAAPLFGCVPNTVRRAAHRICEAAGLPKVTPHGLRGSLSSHAAEAGEDESLAARVLGHTVAVARKHYTTADAQQERVRRQGLKVLQGGKSSTGTK